MIEKNDYSNLSSEELVAKQKSLNNWKKIVIGITVLSVVMTLYAIYRDNVGKHTFFTLGSLLLIAINSNKLKKVEEEIEKRNK